MARVNLIMFQWFNQAAELQVARYATQPGQDFAAPTVLAGGEAYVPLVCSIRPARRDGTLQDRPWEIDLPTATYPINQMATGYPFPEVTCRIDACDAEDPDGTRLLVWYGRVQSRPRVNPGNRAGLSRIKILGIKSYLALPTIGAPATEVCSHAQFGDDRCGFDVSTVTYAGATIVTSQHGGYLDRVAVTHPSIVGELDPAAWVEGTLKVNGAEVNIVRALAGGVIQIDAIADPAWAGLTDAVLIEGCTRLQSRCRQLGNQKRWTGLGFRMAPYNPAFTG